MRYLVTPAEHGAGETATPGEEVGGIFRRLGYLLTLFEENFPIFSEAMDTHATCDRPVFNVLLKQSPDARLSVRTFPNKGTQDANGDD